MKRKNPTKRVIQWKTNQETITWNLVAGESLPADLVKLIMEFTHSKSIWFRQKYGSKLGGEIELTKEATEDLEQDLSVKALEAIATYDNAQASFHTYLNKIYNNHYSNVTDPNRPTTGEKYGVGRIVYNSEHKKITGEDDDED